MSRLVLTRFGEPAESIELDETPLGPPASDAVTVEMVAAPINPAEVLLARGHYAVRPQLPAPMGAEGIGRVVAVGDAVDPLLHGRLVLILPNYEYGTWADRVNMAARNVIPLRDDVDPLQLAMLGVNPATAHLLLLRHGQLPAGSWIAQTAANSAMGRYIIALAKRQGLRTLNVVRREETVAELRQAGADAVVVAGDTLSEQIRQALAGDELSLILDATGGPVIKDLVRALRFRGSVVNYAFPEGPARVSAADIVFRELTLTGFWLMNWIRSAPHAEVTQTYSDLADLIATGDLTAPVAATYSLGDHVKAFEHATANGRSGKVLFDFR